MPWELVVVKYDGKPPRLQRDSDKNRQLPLGTLDEVRDHISSLLPGIEWHVEPSLIEMMKANGSGLWKNWDERMIADASKPKLKATLIRDDMSFEMFGFEQDGPLRFFLLDVRGRENPLPLLRALCETKGWSIAEMGKDGEYLDLTGSSAQDRWDGWQRYLSAAINRE